MGEIKMFSMEVLPEIQKTIGGKVEDSVFTRTYPGGERAVIVEDAYQDRIMLRIYEEKDGAVGVANEMHVGNAAVEFSGETVIFVSPSSQKGQMVKCAKITEGSWSIGSEDPSGSIKEANMLATQNLPAG